MFWLDTVLLAILGFSALLGAMSGLLWQVARLATLSAAVYAAVLLNDQASTIIHDGLMQGAEPRLIQMSAFLAVFIVAYLILFAVTRLLYQGMEAVRLAPVDRLLGAGLGSAKVACFLAALCWGLTSFSHPHTKEWMDQSRLAPALVEGMDSLLQVVPPEIKTELCEGMKHIKELTQGKVN